MSVVVRVLIVIFSYAILITTVIKMFISTKLFV